MWQAVLTGQFMKLSDRYKIDQKLGVHLPPDLEAFNYSDGKDEERQLLENVLGCEDTSVYSKTLRKFRVNWPTNYHLSPQRCNLLRPFAETFKAGAQVLEIGAGCGALSRFAGEMGAKVTALEGSLLRAAITAARCKDLENVLVVCDNFQKFSCSEKFDVVTLIGVLEYSQLFITAPDPVQEMLRKARSFLKPGGFLLLAIENQLGLKYFCGSSEDHVQKFAFGINDSYSKDSVITFGRVDLEKKIKEAGFFKAELFLPFPDYKMPSCVLYPGGLKERGAWKPGPLVASSVVFEAQPPPFYLFSLEQAWQVVARNGLLADLANSFLFRAYNESCELAEESSPTMAAHYGYEKEKEDFVEKRFVCGENGELETRVSKMQAPSSLDSYRVMPYQPGEIYGDGLTKLMNIPGWSVADVAKWAEPWVAALREHAFKTESTEVDGTSFDLFLPSNFFDAIPLNLAVDSESGAARFFDIECDVQTPLPFEFLVFRGLCIMIHRITSCAKPAGDSPQRIAELVLKVLEVLKIKTPQSKVQTFLSLFNNFQNQASRFSKDAVHPLTEAIVRGTFPVRLI